METRVENKEGSLQEKKVCVGERNSLNYDYFALHEEVFWMQIALVVFITILQTSSVSIIESLIIVREEQALWCFFRI